MSGKEITQYEAAGLDEKMRYVQTLTSAGDLIPKGLFAITKNAQGLNVNAPSAGKVLLVLETGAMLGVHPMAALGGIHVIEGKPTISPGLMSGLVRKAGHKLRVTTTGTIKGNDFAATATITRSDDPDFTYTATWTIERATRAGLAGKAVWKNYGEAMCKARAIGEVCREATEDVLMGVSYTPEEMGALVDDGGEMVEVKPAEPSEDWSALIFAVESKAALRLLADRIRGIGDNKEQVGPNEMTPELRDAIMARAGKLPAEEDEPAEPAAEAKAGTPAKPAAPEPEEEVIDAEIVEDPEPEVVAPAAEPTELSEEEWEKQNAAEFDSVRRA